MNKQLDEIWRPCLNYKGYYASNRGRLKNSIGFILPEHFCKGYLQVSIKTEGKWKSIKKHKLICDAFLGLIPKGLQTRHLDGNKINNNILNLAYGTQSENSQDKALHDTHSKGEKNPNNKLKEGEILQIVELFNCGLTNFEIAHYLNIKKATINNILSGRQWSWLTNITYNLLTL